VAVAVLSSNFESQGMSSLSVTARKQCSAVVHACGLVLRATSGIPFHLFVTAICCFCRILAPSTFSTVGPQSWKDTAKPCITGACLGYCACVHNHKINYHTDRKVSICCIWAHAAGDNYEENIIRIVIPLMPSQNHGFGEVKCPTRFLRIL
jgi:hypothetical protein